MSFSLQNAIEITDSNKWIDIEVATVEHSYSITTGTYGSLQQVVDAFETAMSPYSVDCKIDSDTYKVYLYRASQCKILFSTGTNAANSCRDVLGFAHVDVEFGTIQYPGTYFGEGIFPGILPTVYEEDSGDRPRVIGPATYYALSGKAERLTAATVYPRRLNLRFISEARWFDDDSLTPMNNQGTYLDWWKAASECVYFRYYVGDPQYLSNMVGTYALLNQPNEDLLGAPRLSPGDAYYDHTITMLLQTDIADPT